MWHRARRRRRLPRTRGRPSDRRRRLDHAHHSSREHEPDDRGDRRAPRRGDLTTCMIAVDDPLDRRARRGDRRARSRCAGALQVPSSACPIPQTSRASTVETTPHPAQIPHEVAGNARPHPLIPATLGRKALLTPRHPRLSPLRPEAPRPACHAGGRGFESRRSRKSPANQYMCLT
jgi:hypothetical protein